MGQRYTITRDNITPTAGNDVLTIVSASARRVRLIDVSVAGQGATSAGQRLIAARSTGGTTGGGAITPNKAEHSEQPAAASVVNTTWSVQPSIDANGVIVGFNALGMNRVPSPPGRPNGIVEARNAENISIRAPSGGIAPQAMSISVTIEED